MTDAVQPIPGTQKHRDGATQCGDVRQRRRVLFIAVCHSLAECLVLITGVQLAGCGSNSIDLCVDRADVACVTLPEPTVETGGIRFAQVAHERGLLHVWPRQPRPMTLRETFGCGCATFDYNNDGLQDVLLVADPHPVLFRNTGGGRFENVTADSGLKPIQAHRPTASRREPGADEAGSSHHGRAQGHTRTRSAEWADWTGVAVGDYDGDGWLDVLLTGFHRLALFRNDGGGGFIDVTRQVGLDPDNHGHWGSSAGFMDLDGDAVLDLVILNYVVFGPGSKQYCELALGVESGCPPNFYHPERGEVWRNTGRGAFELLAGEAAMHETSGVAMVLAFTDLDDDNRQDVYIGNDRTRAEFLHNQGEMEFKNTSIEIGLTVGPGWIPMAAMGADWGDFNRDGLLDLTVTDYQGNSFALFKHEAHELDGGAEWHSFEEVGHPTGVGLATRASLGFGAKWLDMDNDGWPDLCYANGHVYDNAGEIKAGETLRQASLLLRNEKGRRFVDLTPALEPAVATPIVGRGSATADFNNDGRVDLLIVDYEGAPLLLENQSQTENHWIKFDLRGADANTFAYGARVTAKTDDTVCVGEVSPASSYLSSSDPRIHFGLGKSTVLETVTIRWPSGRTEELHDVTADQIVRITERPGMRAGN
ncbi:MAG TPA: CRTAC1 family protein [Pirellulales bacterium]|nr:CRTAC1 family protein [Pirellulales bacterium]